MPLTIKLLGANGISGAGTTPLYTVPGSVLGAIVNNVRLANNSVSAITVNLYFTPNLGNQVRILEKDKSIPVGQTLVVKPELTMAPSDKIELTTVAGTTLDYVVCGAEKV
jgi:hypothetical protein